MHLMKKQKGYYCPCPEGSKYCNRPMPPGNECETIVDGKNVLGRKVATECIPVPAFQRAKKLRGKPCLTGTNERTLGYSFKKNYYPCLTKFPVDSLAKAAIMAEQMGYYPSNTNSMKQFMAHLENKPNQFGLKGPSGQEDTKKLLAKDVKAPIFILQEGLRFLISKNIKMTQISRMRIITVANSASIQEHHHNWIQLPPSEIGGYPNTDVYFFNGAGAPKDLIPVLQTIRNARKSKPTYVIANLEFFTPENVRELQQGKYADSIQIAGYLNDTARGSISKYDNSKYILMKLYGYGKLKLNHFVQWSAFNKDMETKVLETAADNWKVLIVNKMVPSWNYKKIKESKKDVKRITTSSILWQASQYPDKQIVLIMDFSGMGCGYVDRLLVNLAGRIRQKALIYAPTKIPAQDDYFSSKKISVTENASDHYVKITLSPKA